MKAKDLKARQDLLLMQQRNEAHQAFFQAIRTQALENGLAQPPWMAYEDLTERSFNAFCWFKAKLANQLSENDLPSIQQTLKHLSECEAAFSQSLTQSTNSFYESDLPALLLDLFNQLKLDIFSPAAELALRILRQHLPQNYVQANYLSNRGAKKIFAKFISLECPACAEHSICLLNASSREKFESELFHANHSLITIFDFMKCNYSQSPGLTKAIVGLLYKLEMAILKEHSVVRSKGRISFRDACCGFGVGRFGLQMPRANWGRFCGLRQALRTT